MKKANKWVIILVTAYIAALTLANISVAHFGMWSTPLNAFLLIGFSCVARDALHGMWGGRLERAVKMLLLIVTAGLLSLVVHADAGRIALASTVAFVVSETIDWFAYSLLYKRHFLVRSNGSNIFGNISDSILFPIIAFGTVPGVAAVMGVQLFAKRFGGFLWSLLINRTLKPRSEERKSTRLNSSHVAIS